MEEVIDAFRRFAAHGYRHIPVVAQGELGGIISMRDLVMKLRRGPAATAHGAVGPSAAAEVLPRSPPISPAPCSRCWKPGGPPSSRCGCPTGLELSYRSCAST